MDAGKTKANPVPAGSDVSGGRKRLPPCPEWGNGQYETVSGGDSIDDPYPDA